MNTFKKILILILFIVINLSCSNHYYYNQKIENLFKLYKDNSQVNQLKALMYAKQASLLAENYGDTKGKTYSYIYMSRSLFFMGNQKESIEFMEKAIKEKYYEKDPVAQAMVCQIKHNNYTNLGLRFEGAKKSFEILELLNKEKGFDAAYIRLRATCNVVGYYIDEKKYDRAKIYLNNATSLTKDTVFFNKDIDESRSFIFIQKARIFQALHQNDSALFYYQKSVLQVQNNPKITKFFQNFTLGEFYSKEGNLQQALKYYLLTAEDMDLRKWEYSNSRLNTYYQIADIYGKLNNMEKKEFYESKYNSEGLKKLDEYNKNIQKTISIILNEDNERHIIIIQKNYWFIIAFIILLVIVLSVLGYKKHISIKTQNEMIIEEKEKQTIKLTENVEKNKFNEMIKLAKCNDPRFLILFEELYPPFISKLKELDPKNRNTELAFCALAYLNFSTKDIAEYTFVTARAVEKRKSRLRKNTISPQMKISTDG